MWVWSLGQENPLEKETATCSSILAWEIPRPEEPGRLQFTGSQRVGNDSCWAAIHHSPQDIWKMPPNSPPSPLCLVTWANSSDKAPAEVGTNWRPSHSQKLSLLPSISIISVQFSRSVVSNSLWPHGLQHARFSCPSPTPRACSHSCPLSRWCHYLSLSIYYSICHYQSLWYLQKLSPSSLLLPNVSLVRLGNGKSKNHLFSGQEAMRLLRGYREFCKGCRAYRAIKATAKPVPRGFSTHCCAGWWCLIRQLFQNRKIQGKIWEREREREREREQERAVQPQLGRMPLSPK